MGLEKNIQEIQGLRKTEDEAHSQTQDKLKQLREKIRNGEESTGDKVKDFVIAYAGLNMEEFEKPYREIETKLKGQAGKQILIVEKEKEIPRYTGIGVPEYENLFPKDDINFRLGVLTGDLEIDVPNAKMIIPTEGYATKSGHFKDWELKGGSISFDRWEISKLNKELYNKISAINLGIGLNYNISFHVGQEVEKQFEDKLFSSLDLSYNKALALLGQKAPQRFQEAYEEKRYETGINTINELEKLIVTTGDQESIIKCLNNAIEYDVHKMDQTIEPRKGLKINIQEYVTGMCEKYDVNIPE